MPTLAEIIDDRISRLPSHSFPKPAGPAIPRFVKAGMIPMKDLVKGHYYGGCCRNATIARWDGTEFTYMRTKFRDTFQETIQHPERDNEYDLFVPVMDLGMLDFAVIGRKEQPTERLEPKQGAKECAKEQDEKSKQDHVV